MEPSKYTVLCLPCSSQRECSAVSARAGKIDAQQASASANKRAKRGVGRTRMRSARHGWTHAQGLNPADLGVDAAIVMQLQAPIRRRPRAQGITDVPREELRL